MFVSARPNTLFNRNMDNSQYGPGDAADHLAVLASKQGKLNPTTEMCYKNCYNLLDIHCNTQWRNTYTTRQGAGSWTRNLIQDPMKQPWFSDFPDLPIRTITIINRILLGHGRNNLFMYRMGKRLNPLCDLCDLAE
ncbi:unnamed protein product [Nesidiocoris tenuis]|uniref:Uncharacterized protein n=1 Tax=Nesidiocoris tenuis TaxID=355587 RepID=A0A6H5HIS3_9HEMI|nr:unnamed protein product [Nesidiocoris tenuis]